MLYTPILVDRLQLTYPSGLAVANILRALTDKRLLRQSIAQLASGMGLGSVVAFLTERIAFVGVTGVSASTVGAGMIVASRIAVPGVVMGGIGLLATPHLREIGWLGQQDSFRKIGFLMGLAMILGAALVDLTLIFVAAARRVREQAGQPRMEEAPWQKVRTGRLVAWVVAWGAALLVVATVVLQQPPGFILFAILLSLLFVMINGISNGISDSNPISSAFVISVLLMSALGLRDPTVGMMAASILLISCSVGVDMQQDRSTGWRLGTDRTIQFRFQVIGIVMGAVMCVVLANLLMAAYPVLAVNSYADPTAKVDQWQSAMTFKFVGALSDLGHLPAYKVTALLGGLVFGVITEVLRKLLHANPQYRAYTASGTGFAVGWTLDAVLLSSPYALSFGGFVEFPVALWFAAGGVLTSVVNTVSARKARDPDLPEDMSTTSLVGGGLIAGEALYALGVGILSLLALARM